MQLFAHGAGREDPELIEIEASVLVRELIVGIDPDGRVWIEEVDEPLDLQVTLEQAGLRHGHHVHRGRCHRIGVAVRFNGVRRERSFGPGTTIKTVYRWAAGSEGFNLSADEAVKHVLALPGADHFLDSSVHIGSLVTAGTCDAVFDLLPRERFEG